MVSKMKREVFKSLKGYLLCCYISNLGPYPGGMRFANAGSYPFYNCVRPCAKKCVGEVLGNLKRALTYLLSFN
jgi:hypothetical protein